MENTAMDNVLELKYDSQISFHLDALLRPDMQQWLMEHFINISMKVEGFGNVDFIDNYIDDSYKLFFDEYTIRSYAEIRDIAETYFADQLKRGNYLFINIDRYYISVNDYTEKEHFVHPILVVGLKDNDTIYHCIDFSPSKGRVYLDIPFGELITSYHKASEYYHYGSGIAILEESVISFRLKSAFRYGYKERDHKHDSFDIRRFTSELHDYLTGTVRANREPEVYQKSDRRICFGIRVYDALCAQYQRHLKEGGCLAFKSIYDFALQKKLIQERLQYIARLYRLSDTAIASIQAYNMVVKKTEALPLLNLKYNIKDGVQANILSCNPAFADKLLFELPEIRDLEYRILYALYDELCDDVPKKSDQSVPVTHYEKKLNQKLKDNQYTQELCLDKEYVIRRLMITFPKNSLPHRAEIWINDSMYPVDTRAIYRQKILLEFQPVCKTDRIRYSADVSADQVSLTPYTNPSEIIVDFNHFHALHMDLESDMDLERSFTAIVHGIDPYIWFETPFSADEQAYLYLRYKTNCQSQAADIYFRDYEEHVGGKKITIAPMNEFYEYIVDMSDCESWKGMIRMLRIDPVDYDNKTEAGRCEVESLVVSDRLPVYDSSKQYGSAQGLNGWFYYRYDGELTYREMICTNDIFCASDEPRLMIDKDIQTSVCQLISVRAWVCPSRGRYEIHAVLSIDDDPDWTSFVVKRNHTEISYYYLPEGQREYQDILALEKGEVLKFEFYNGYADIVKSIQSKIVIRKIY